MRSCEDNPNDQDYILQLYEAALKGSVANLTSLIRNDPLILHKISLTSITETPLHLSALAGHLEFTDALLSEKSELATRLDSRNRSPLHLASAEGHVRVVEALLRANADVCMVRDDEGRIPLHLGVMRGHVEVVHVLINARTTSVVEKLNGDTVLHLAVKYNQLKALRLLVKQLNIEDEIFNFTDHLGNTILHSAVMMKQTETIKYLVSLPEMKANTNSINRMGLSALDLLELYPRDFKGLEIGDILIKAGSRRSIYDANDDPNPPKTFPTQPKLVKAAVKSRYHKLGLKGKTKSVYRRCKSYLRHQSNWAEKMQGTLMLVATLTATISFQVATNPPGGVWQQDYTDLSVGNFNCSTDYKKCVAGSAVLGYVYPIKYGMFTRYAIITFIASLSVVLLAISGLPLKNKFCTWLMTIAMIYAIMGLLLTFGTTVMMVTPTHILVAASEALSPTTIVWVFLLGLVAVFATIRLLFWLSSLLVKFISLVRKILSPDRKKNEGFI